MLSWDMSVMMPPGGADARAEQLAVLKVTVHDLITRDDTGELLQRAESEQGLDAWQHANLREMRRQFVHASAVPADLVEALSKACSASEMVWRKARPAADYAMLRPHL